MTWSHRSGAPENAGSQRLIAIAEAGERHDRAPPYGGLLLLLLQRGEPGAVTSTHTS